MLLLTIAIVGALTLSLTALAVHTRWVRAGRPRGVESVERSVTTR